VGTGKFSPLHRVQTGSKAHPASYSMDTSGSFSGRGVKLTTHIHLVPRSHNERSYTSIPPIRLHGGVLGLKKVDVETGKL